MPDDCRRAVREVAVRLLARREHARVELEHKLAARGHSAELVESVVADLAAGDLQSDQRFAETFVRSSLSRGHGPLKIRAGLRERGVDDESALADLDDDEWCDHARTALEKRFGDGPSADRAEWTKRARFLASRGFTSSVTSRVLGDLDRIPHRKALGNKIGWQSP